MNMELIKKKEEGKYIRCWACDILCLNKTRVDYHHVFGRSREELTPLCHACHDVVDQISLNDIEVFGEFMKAAQELEELPRGRTRYLRILLLKSVKLIKMIEEDANREKAV